VNFIYGNATIIILIIIDFIGREMSDGRPSSSNSRTALFRAGTGLNIENEVTGPTQANRGLARPNSSMEMNVIPSVNLADKVKRLSNDMQVN